MVELTERSENKSWHRSHIGPRMLSNKKCIKKIKHKKKSIFIILQTNQTSIQITLFSWLQTFFLHKLFANERHPAITSQWKKKKKQTNDGEKTFYFSLSSMQ